MATLEKRKYVRKQGIVVNPVTSSATKQVVNEKVVNKRTLADDSFRAIVAGAKYVVEKNVPIPKSTSIRIKGQSIYPFKFMNVGDSFLAKDGKKVIKGSTVTASAITYSKKTGTKFTVRTTPEGPRCWRIA